VIAALTVLLIALTTTTTTAPLVVVVATRAVEVVVATITVAVVVAAGGTVAVVTKEEATTTIIKAMVGVATSSSHGTRPIPLPATFKHGLRGRARGVPPMVLAFLAHVRRSSLKPSTPTTSTSRSNLLPHSGIRPPSSRRSTTISRPPTARTGTWTQEHPPT
jgi:hypothetical protein